MKHSTEHKNTLKPRIQQIHKNCGGEIVIAADLDRNFSFVCKRCAVQWFYESYFPIKVSIPDEFENASKNLTVLVKKK